MKVFPDCSGFTPLANIIEGIDWVAGQVNPNDNKTVIVNMSLSVPAGENAQILEQAVRDALGRGIVFVVAAGNDFGNACDYAPASLGTGDVITVGGSNRADVVMGESNQGTCVDIFAPGKDIVSAWEGGNSNTRESSGTSMAAPHVAGVAALYLERNPNATPKEVEGAIKAVATAGKLADLRSNTPNLLLYAGLQGNSQPVNVDIDPKNVTLQPGQQQVFTATVTGTTNTAVTWDFSGGGVSGDGSTVTITAPNTAGAYTLTAISVADPSKSATANITVEVSSEPDITDPNPNTVTLNADTNQSVNSSFSFSNTGNAVLTYQTSSSQNWLSVVSNSSGSVPASGNIQVDIQATCPANEGTLQGTIVITSNDPDENVKNFSVTLNCTALQGNRPPVANDDSYSVNEDAFELNISDTALGLLGNDTDPDGDLLEVANILEIQGVNINSGELTTAGLPLPSGAILSVPVNGTFSYQPNGVFESLNGGETTVDTFTYEVTDNRGGTDTGVVRITIIGADD